MRAARSPFDAGKKARVLRVAVVSHGRVIEERVIAQRTPVTVGAREDCTFVIPTTPGGARGPAATFVPTGDGWELRVAPGMQGSVELASGVLDIAATAAPTRVPLTEGARGRVTLGATTLLFQLVPTPPPAPRPRLPLSMRQGFGAQIDWSLTVLVALSFLLHFGLVGGMYSDWMDPAVDSDVTAQLVVLPSPPGPPLPTETQDEATATAQASANEAPSPRAPRPGPHSTPAPAPAPAANSPDALLHEWEQLGVVAIGVMERGPNLRRALQPGEDAPPIDLGVLDRRVGVNDHPFALDLPRAGDPIHPGQSEDLQRSLRHGDTSAVASTAGTVRPVVPFTLEQEPPRTSRRIPNVESVVRSQLQPRARQCFQRAVTADPSLPDGNILVTMRVEPSGEVASVGITRTGLSAQVVSCIAGAAQRLVFDSCEAGGATVTVPMHFVKQ
jgi:hypothetical protein